LNLNGLDFSSISDEFFKIISFVSENNFFFVFAEFELRVIINRHIFVSENNVFFCFADLERDNFVSALKPQKKKRNCFLKQK